MLFPWTLLVQSEQLDAPAAATQPAGILGLLPASHRSASLDKISAAIAGSLHATGAKDVWSYASPLGDQSQYAAAARQLADDTALANYFSAGHHCLRFEVMASASPFTPLAIDDYRTSLAAVQAVLAKNGIKAGVLAFGPTAYMANVQTVAQRDEVRIQTAVVIAVGVVVFLLLRDALLTVVLLAITLIAYFATLGITDLFLVHLLGQAGLDWKIKLFSFVILMAVGQDYNLFLVGRLLEERRRHGLRASIRIAMQRTGGIISSCGLITAVSLGSLCVSGLEFLQQMGFALACGTLLDTFFVRPLMLPALLTLLSRPRRRR